MKKFSILLLGFLGLFNVMAERNFNTYASVCAEWNIIHLYNDPFLQSPPQPLSLQPTPIYGQIMYNKSTGFPALALDFGIKSKKTFRFLRHDNMIACGIKLSASNTNKRLKGLMVFNNETTASDFFVTHKFNIKAVNPYVNIIFTGQNIDFGIGGGVTWYSELFGMFSAHENIAQEWYSGLHLRPRDCAFAGTVKAFAQKEYGNFFGGFSYEYTRGSQRYGSRVFVEQSSAGSRDYLVDFHLLQGIHEALIFEAPTIRFGIHTLSIYFGLSI